MTAFLIQRAKGIPIVLDPVMVAKSGDPLLQNNALESLRSKLIPIASIISSLDACIKAKSYLHEAMLHSKNCSVDKGNGPVHHFHHLWKYL